MYMNTLIYIFAFVLIISVIIYSIRSVRENFDTYGSCVAQGYPFEWCLHVPVDVKDIDSLCSCPAGQKIYKRYGRCFCQTYV